MLRKNWLCKRCLKIARKIDAEEKRIYRLKIKQSEKQVGGKVKVNKVI